MIDNGTEYKKEIENNTNGIVQAPVASKPGWTFVGWKTDRSPDGSILYNHTVKSTTTYYAVYKRTVTVSAYGGDATTNNLGVQYYNSGSISTVNIKLENQPTKAGWQLIGYKNWSDEAANEKCAYVPGDTVQVKEDMKLRAVFKKKVTVTSVTGNNHVKQTSFSGWRYYNNGTIKNPIINLIPEKLNGWNFYTFAEKPKDTIPKYQNRGYEFSTDTNIYPVYRRESAISYDCDGGQLYGTANVDYSVNVAWFYAPGDNLTLFGGANVKMSKNAKNTGWEQANYIVQFNNEKHGSVGNGWTGQTTNNVSWGGFPSVWTNGCYAGTASISAAWPEHLIEDTNNYDQSKLEWETPRYISGPLTTKVGKWGDADTDCHTSSMKYNKTPSIHPRDFVGDQCWILVYGKTENGVWTQIGQWACNTSESLIYRPENDSNSLWPVSINIQDGWYRGIRIVATGSAAYIPYHNNMKDPMVYELTICEGAGCSGGTHNGWGPSYMRFTLGLLPLGPKGIAFDVNGLPR